MSKTTRTDGDTGTGATRTGTGAPGTGTGATGTGTGATGTGTGAGSDGGTDRLMLGDVRRIFRLVGEIRELGADPEKWRPHMVLALRKLMGAEVVVSSEIHFHKV